MRWFPRSITGQLLTLWLLALLAAHIIAVLVMTWWRADNGTIHPLSVRTIETRILSAYRVAGRAPDATALLNDISLPDSTFRLSATSSANAPEMDEHEQVLSQRVHKLLGIADDEPVYVHLWQIEPDRTADSRGNWLERTFGAFRGTHAWALDIEVRLPDGQWLRSRHWPTMLPAHWNRVLSFSLLVGMLPTAIIALLFGRRIMRPLRVLTEASQRVSRGERVMLPQPDGPSGVREITQAFNDMQESLMRFVNGRTQMIAAIGHDLRTPLTSLRIRSELIDDDALRDAMVQTLDEMSVMVEETLQFARDDALHEPTQDVRIGGLVHEVVEGQRLQGRQVTCTASIDDDMYYRCRPVHLKRALTNIIDNAARYGEVSVRILADTLQGKLRIDIEDSGPGIDPDHLDRVFEPFARLDVARNKDAGGIGLGLAIARSSIRAHGGEVTLRNRAEGGLCAAIALPL